MTDGMSRAVRGCGETRGTKLLPMNNVDEMQIQQEFGGFHRSFVLLEVRRGFGWVCLRQLFVGQEKRGIITGRISGRVGG